MRPRFYLTLWPSTLFSEELLNIEELKIEITDRGLTQISEKGNLMRCATSWKDEQAFKKLFVDRLTN